MSNSCVAVVGTADTKGAELDYLRAVIEGVGVGCRVVDVGVRGPAACSAFVAAHEVMRTAGVEPDEFRAMGRSDALGQMARGATTIVRGWLDDGHIDGVLCLGGSGGASVAAQLMRSLPLGVPKIVVTTQVPISAEQIIGTNDVILFPTVADLAGINRVTRPILHNAAMSLVGMVGHPLHNVLTDSRYVVAASMIGITTPGLSAARTSLEAAGAEVITFHVTGPGGLAMERLLEPCGVTGVLDASTVELADMVVGSPRRVDPARLLGAGRLGIPQVVSLGGLDIARFGPQESVPEGFRRRLWHVHNELVTLVRPTVAESRRIGQELGSRLSQATGAVRVLVPLGGLSTLSVEGGPLYDADADAAVIAGLREGLTDASRISFLEHNINDAAFATQMSSALIELMDRPEGTRSIRNA